MRIFVHKNKQSHGPYSLETLKELLDKDTFSESDLYCYDEKNWVKLCEVPGITPEIVEPIENESVAILKDKLESQELEEERNKTPDYKNITGSVVQEEEQEVSSEEKNSILSFLKNKDFIRKKILPIAIAVASGILLLIFWRAIVAFFLWTIIVLCAVGGCFFVYLSIIEKQSRKRKTKIVIGVSAFLSSILFLLLIPSEKFIDLDDPDSFTEIVALAVEVDKFQVRDKILYIPNEQIPFTGWAKIIHPNGQVKTLTQIEDGMRNGLLTTWYDNGQKNTEENYIDGKPVGLGSAWYKNGQKQFELNFKDGKEDGLQTNWYENGQKMFEVNFKDGKKDGFCIVWYKNGQKKKEENWKGGKLEGLRTEWWYDENGQKRFETIYKNGEKIGETKIF